MKLEKQCFLVLYRNAKPLSQKSSKRLVPPLHLRIVPTIAEATLLWGSSTRLSPIYAVSGFSKKVSPTEFHFDNNQHVVFLGPIHPEKIAHHVGAEPGWHLWLGLGLYNAILVTSSAAKAGKLCKWAEKVAIPFERWEITNGQVRKQIFRLHLTLDPGLRKSLAKLSNRRIIAESQEALAEYVPLMLATASRSGQFPRLMLNDLVDVNRHVEQTVAEIETGASEVTPYRALGQLLTINAALSRFSSQTFAGTSPITEIECHFWSHSLLGVGIASIALWRLNKFMERTLGGARLSARIASFKEVSKQVPRLTKIKNTDVAWAADYLSTVAQPEPAEIQRNIIPLLTYFSAREGFNSTELSISAPLAAVSSCNSLRWSLLTLTHEISHILVTGMLVHIYPDPESPEEIGRAIQLLKPQGGSNEALNLLEEIRRLLLLTISGMDAVHSGGLGKELEIDHERLITLIEHWHREVEEILVHTFDFLYFYGMDFDKYVAGIWISWAVIPNIKNRINDYVVRTICTVMARFLINKDPEELAKGAVVQVLERLEEAGDGGDHIQRALQYIRDHWDQEIKDRVKARKDLIRIGKTFFFSEKLATEVRKENAIIGGATEHEGYSLKINELEAQPISNPLTFLAQYTGSRTPSAVEAAWFFYVLTFLFEDNA